MDIALQRATPVPRISLQLPPETLRSPSLSVPSTPRPKILLYSHDTFGLGNIRRTLLLAEELKNQYEGAAILIVTGSPMIQSFRIPAGVDYVKLPCLDRTDSERYEPRFLQQCADEVKRTRSATPSIRPNSRCRSTPWSTPPSRARSWSTSSSQW